MKISNDVPDLFGEETFELIQLLPRLVMVLPIAESYLLLLTCVFLLTSQGESKVKFSDAALQVSSERYLNFIKKPMKRKTQG